MPSIFPTLPGIQAKRSKAAQFATLVHRAASGRRSAMGQRVFPVWKFTLRYAFLRAKLSQPELQTLQSFFVARKGSLEPFYYRDRDLNTVADQAIGMSANGVLSYPLVYSLGGAVDRVGAVDLTGTAPEVKVGGLVKAASWARNSVLLSSQPPAGYPVTWTGRFFYHVAFSDDAMDFEQFLYQLHSVDGVQFETVNQHD